jgi:C1A family cysteine protease
MHRYGWIPDLPDQRDFLYAMEFPGDIPKSVDLRLHCPPVYNQGTLGSCTANAICAAHQFEQMKQSKFPAFVPSRLFLYYNERVLEDNVYQDAGATLRDGMKVIAKQGVCEETLWPYEPAQFSTKPNKICYIEAMKHQVILYRRINPDIYQMKNCLASGYPFVFGISIYQSFESQEVAKSGIVPMPSKEEQMLGGHAIMAVGYDDEKRCFIVRNSWGEGWGEKGYCYIPYEYLSNQDLACDFWTIRVIEISN